MAERRPAHALRAAGLLFLLYGCGELPTRSGFGDARLQVQAEVTGLPISVIAVEVSGPGIDVPLVFNLGLADGVASGTLHVPSGSARLLTGRAFDSRGIETHRGSRLLDVRPTHNDPVQITLLPVDGNQPVGIVVGHYSVTVTPTAATLSVGDTLRVVAVVRDADDEIVELAVNWATLDAAITTVHPGGLVVAHSPGPGRIVALVGDRAAIASITVAP